jgi:hypothetical protein
MSDRDGLLRVRPRSRAEREQLLALCGGVLLGILCVAGLFYNRYITQRNREQNWDSAVATIEDVQTKLVEMSDSRYGGVLLYSVQVLAKFAVDGVPQERWITVEQAPESLAYAQLQARMWKGERCFVRWKPSHPEQIAVELH